MWIILKSIKQKVLNIIEDSWYLQSEQVTLQTVTYEDGFSAEHAEQHSLNISQTDGGVFQVLLRHTWKSVKYMLPLEYCGVTGLQLTITFISSKSHMQTRPTQGQAAGDKLTACCNQPLCFQVWQTCRRWLSTRSRWLSPSSAPGPASCNTD